MIAPDEMVATPTSWRRAASWLPPLMVKRRLYVGPTGEILRCSDAGRLELVIQGSLPFGRSVAADPDPGARP